MRLSEKIHQPVGRKRPRADGLFKLKGYIKSRITNCRAEPSGLQLYPQSGADTHGSVIDRGAGI